MTTEDVSLANSELGDDSFFTNTQANEAFTFISKHIVLPVGLNATAGAMAGAILKCSTLTTLATGALSGVLQSALFVPRDYIWDKIDENFSGAAKTTLIALTAISMYAMQLPILMVAGNLAKNPFTWGQALSLTIISGGFTALEYASIQHLIDQSTTKEPIKLT